MLADVHYVTIIGLLLIAAISFGKLIIFGDSDDKSLQKIFGGLIVVIAALNSLDPWVISISIFVAGLIVASEDFMKFFAAVMRTSGDKVAETVVALKTEKISKVEAEVRIQKESRDVKLPSDEINASERILPKQSDVATTLVCSPGSKPDRVFKNDDAKKRVEKIRNIYSQVCGTLIIHYGDRFQSQMKLSLGGKSVIVDGVVKNGDKIVKIIEFKYITSKSYPNLKYMIIRLRDKLRALGLNARIQLVIVSDDISIQDAIKMKEDNKGLAGLTFFRLDDNGSIVQVEPIESAS